MSGVNLSAANVRSDGVGTIGTDIFIAATADATNGGFVRDVTFYPVASAANTAMTTTSVGRVFACSVSSGLTTIANTFPLGEVTLTNQTAASSTTATFPVVLPINKALPPGWTILVTTHALTAGVSSWRAVVTLGKY
jgi:hypothetical protein